MVGSKYSNGQGSLFKTVVNFIIKALVIVYCLTLSASNSESLGKRKLITPLKSVTFYNSDDVPDYIISALREIAVAAGETKITISSNQRSVKKQVEVMLDYYITCEKISDIENKKTCGIELARQVYDLECQAGFDVFDETASRSQNVRLMTEALKASLIELGERRRCMNHVVIPNIKTKIIAVDIKPSLITNHTKFYDAVVENDKVILFYYPEIKGKPKSEVKDAAFHLGFKRQ